MITSPSYLKPYLGAGITFASLFSSEDGALKNASLDPAFAAVFQGRRICKQLSKPFHKRR